MKVVLDTNVIVAAFAARGLCAELFKVCLSKYEIILSEYILLEVSKNLTKKIKLPQAIVEEILHFLREPSWKKLSNMVRRRRCPIYLFRKDNI